LLLECFFGAEHEEIIFVVRKSSLDYDVASVNLKCWVTLIATQKTRGEIV